MPSKGSKVLQVRVPPDLLAAVELQIQQRNIFTREAPWNISDWIRCAMEEKLKKMERSRRSRDKSAPPATAIEKN